MRPAPLPCPQERGWNAIEFAFAHNCWARDIGIINADNGIVMNGGWMGRLEA